MTLDQGLAFGIVAAMMGLFVWARLRYDLVAMLALLASVAVGIVPADKAFAGFGDHLVVVVASALLVSAAVAKSGIAERLISPLAPYLVTVQRQILVLVGVVTLLSAFVKNVGALAIMMPIAFQLARRTGTSPSSLLMPMAFGSLLGHPFTMFDFLPVGAAIAAVGLAFLAFGYRLLPSGRKGSASIEAVFNIDADTTEVTLPEDSPLAGKPVAELEALSDGEVTVKAIIRDRFRHYAPPSYATLQAGDALILRAEPAALERLVGRANLMRDFLTPIGH
jgi:di/tricarboxylate transporter